ncbi:acyl-CoA synthetase [Usitatibacter palustris]|uniref:Long-chain-fatty-acid--CoA ligase n=1 Tax=Usitatibacter palustris TaxID=2732487 RepID=A0A6M4H5Z2_9PROT|nr:acyl-CoA synthetase [Usitatibacter palustris]QJR14920.1 Long-chain-fatty-acid--CoA ligase [Usitatibacter palustris]
MDRNPANFAPLSPVTFLARAAEVYPGKVAIRHGAQSITYRQFDERVRRFASALVKRGIVHGDTVATVAPNVPAQLEAHYAVPGLGAVLNAINYRLDARTIAFILDHGEAKILLVDGEFAPVVAEALKLCKAKPLVVDVDDGVGPCIGSMTYADLLEEGDAAFELPGPRDEWDSMCLLYTSGTTGDPKGVVYHHRGGYLNSLGNALMFGLSAESVYLWTLPMFHCSGWSYTWAVTAVGGTHICLRRVDPALIFPAIRDHGVTHLCGAPIVLNMLVHAPDAVKLRFDHAIEVATGGAAPPSAVIEGMERMGFRVTHLYGLTESYGPATLCAWQDEWNDLPLEQRARLMARQGVRYPTLSGMQVADPETHEPVPRDGATLGEVMLRGHTIMKGYFKNPRATEEAFREGWYHSGDLAVWHPDNYIEVKDRSKDIIISGGENISSLELEECLYRHPKVMEAAVVARPDDKWGETPCAFVTLKPGASATVEEIVAWCREHVAGFKIPKTVVFGALPKTSTGKIQKFILREQARTL